MIELKYKLINPTLQKIIDVKQKIFDAGALRITHTLSVEGGTEVCNMIASFPEVSTFD